jgi:hypothetical protein
MFSCLSIAFGGLWFYEVPEPLSSGFYRFAWIFIGGLALLSWFRVFLQCAQTVLKSAGSKGVFFLIGGACFVVSKSLALYAVWGFEPAVH